MQLMSEVNIDHLQIGNGRPLAVIAGPCVIESLDLCRAVANRVQ
jgi:3-deoxy-D-manno-octulosonic acid (KDO) 8-phosphate synthase